MNGMKVLIINISRLGDFISGKIIIDEAILKYKNVSVMINPDYVGLLDPSIGFINNAAEAQKQTWDLVIDLTGAKKTRKLVRSLTAKEKIGRIRKKSLYKAFLTYNKVYPKDEFKHIVKDFYPILSYFGKSESIPHIPVLNPSSETQKRVAIHFGAAMPKR